MNAAEFIQTGLVLIFGLFIIYQVVIALIQSDPGFAKYGLPILAAAGIGVVAYFKRGN